MKTDAKVGAKTVGQSQVKSGGMTWEEYVSRYVSKRDTEKPDDDENKVAESLANETVAHFEQAFAEMK